MPSGEGVAVNLVTVEGHTIDTDLLTPGRVALDVGCRGFGTANLLRERGLRVVALDPAPDVEAPADPGIWFRRVALLPRRRMDTTRRLLMSCGGEGYRVVFNSAEKSIACEAVTLEGLAHSFGATQWDLIKLDCEGMEYEVLREIDGPIARQIVVEYHDFLGLGPPDSSYYDRLHRQLSEWYEVAKHVKEPAPWDSSKSFFLDSRYVLRREHWHD